MEPILPSRQIFQCFPKFSVSILLDILGVLFALIPILISEGDSIYHGLGFVGSNLPRAFLYMCGISLCGHKTLEMIFDFTFMNSKKSRNYWSSLAYIIALISMTFTSIILFVAVFAFNSLWFEYGVAGMSFVLVVSASIDLCLSEHNVNGKGRCIWNSILLLLLGMSEGCVSLSLSALNDAMNDIRNPGDSWDLLASTISSVFCGILFRRLFYENKRIMSAQTKYDENDYRSKSALFILKVTVTLLALVKIGIPISRIWFSPSYSIEWGIHIRYVSSLILVYVITWIPHFELMEVLENILVSYILIPFTALF